MPAYSLNSNTETSVQSPKLKKGKVRIYTSTTIFWAIGEEPVAQRHGGALLKGGETLELNLPVSCSRLAVLAANENGTVTVAEISGGARASCSA